MRRWLLALVLGFATVSLLVATGVVDAADRAVMAHLVLTDDGSSSMLIAVMQGISWIGGGLPRWGLVILLGLLVWHWCGRRCVAAFYGVSLLSNLASSLLKMAFARLRPDLVPHLDHQTSFSYPSGHATSAAAVYLMLAWLAPPRWRPAAWSLAVIMILLNGVSRMMLGVHWPSDIVGGTLLGATFVLLGAWWIGSRDGREAKGPVVPQS